MLNRNIRHMFVLGLVAGVILTVPAAQADSFFPTRLGDLSPSPVPHAATDATDGAAGLGGLVPGGSLPMYNNAPAFGPRGFGLMEPDAFSLSSAPARPVPAPPAFLLLGAGFLGIVYLGRWRNFRARSPL